MHGIMASYTQRQEVVDVVAPALTLEYNVVWRQIVRRLAEPTVVTVTPIHV